MSLIKTLADLIRKLTQEGVDLDDVGISEDNLWYRGEDDDESPDDQD